MALGQPYGYTVNATGTQVTSASTSAAVAISNAADGNRARRIRLQCTGNAYVRPRVASASVTLGNNPMTSTNGQATVVVTHTAHGYSNGDSVIIAGATAFNSLTIGQLNGIFTISAVTANTYTITTTGSANASSAGGGAAVTEQQVSACTVNDILLSPNYDVVLNVKPFTHLVYLQQAAGALINLTPIEDI